MWSILLWALYILIALPFLFILLVVLAAVYAGLALRHSIRVASKSPCPKCGAVLGRAAVLAGQERWKQKLQDLSQKHPGVRFRVLAEWEIVCPACGLQVYFCPETHKLTVESIRSFPGDATKLRTLSAAKLLRVEDE